jgi:hypothetical protein
MTRKRINCPTAGLVAATLALGAAGPAGAHPIGNDSPVRVAPPQVQHYGRANVLPPFTGIKVPYYGKANVLPPFVPEHVQGPPETVAPVATITPRAVADHPASGGSSDLVYIIVGGVIVAIGGLGGAFVAGRHRGARTAAPRSTIAA